VRELLGANPADVGPSWTPRSAHRERSNRGIVNAWIGVVNGQIGVVNA